MTLMALTLMEWFVSVGVDPAIAFFAMEIALAVMLMMTLVILSVKARLADRTRQSLAEVAQTLDSVSEQEIIMRAIVENANDGLVFHDMYGRIIWANAAYLRSMGYCLDEIIGRRPQEFCVSSAPPISKDEMDNCRLDPDSAEFDGLVRREVYRKSGETFWEEYSLSLVHLKSGEQRVILVSRDVTGQVHRELELEEAQAYLYHAAHHDALTALLNRSAFLQATDKVLHHKGQRTEVGLIYIDLDHFKAVNDTNGHAAGDQLLLHVANAMRDTARPGDLPCRMGGDEFVMACPGVTDFDTLQMIADTLLERIRIPITFDDAILSCGASIGLALDTGAADRAEDLIRSADFALYEAKVPGAPAIARYDANLHDRQTAENTLMEQFVDALDCDGIDFMYQPILDARTGKIRSFEALARWHHPDGRVIGPDVFLGFAARVNRMTDVDFSAIRATASLVADLNKLGHGIRGAFNVSSESLAHPDFMTTLQHEVREARLSPEMLVAEVLETTFFGADTTDSLAATRINDLRNLGYSVFLDDFGVGYAGLSHLSQLNVSGVKLDRSLIANVTNDRSARIITTAILRLCDELGVGTLGEGIESLEQAEFLAAQGCYRLQGFGIARPMTRDDVIKMVEAGAPISIPPAPSLIARSA